MAMDPIGIFEALAHFAGGAGAGYAEREKLEAMQEHDRMMAELDRAFQRQQALEERRFKKEMVVRKEQHEINLADRAEALEREMTQAQIDAQLQGIDDKIAAEQIMTYAGYQMNLAAQMAQHVPPGELADYFAMVDDAVRRTFTTKKLTVGEVDEIWGKVKEIMPQAALYGMEAEFMTAFEKAATDYGSAMGIDPDVVMSQWAKAYWHSAKKRGFHNAAEHLNTLHMLGHQGQTIQEFYRQRAAGEEGEKKKGGRGEGILGSATSILPEGIEDSAADFYRGMATAPFEATKNVLSSGATVKEFPFVPTAGTYAGAVGAITENVPPLDMMYDILVSGGLFGDRKTKPPYGRFDLKRLIGGIHKGIPLTKEEEEELEYLLEESKSIRKVR